MIVHPNERRDSRPYQLSRRRLLLGSLRGERRDELRHAQAGEPAVDQTICIGPVSLELAPGETIKTTG